MSGSAAPTGRSPSARPNAPEDVIYATDYILPTLIAGGHAAWIWSKYASMLGGNVEDARSAGGALSLPLSEPLYMVAGYLVGLFVLWHYYEGISPARCRAAMIVHNVYLTLLSAFMAVVVFQETLGSSLPWAAGPGAVLALGPSGIAKAAFGHPLDMSPKGVRLAWILWVNYNSKFVEFLDTVFMLMRKKYRQVTFLHVQHHAVMGPIMWLIITRSPGGPSYFGPLLNSIVHTVMYAYYACIAAKVSWPLPKQSVTVMQMLQFVVIAGHGFWNLTHPGAWPVLLTYVELGLMVNMLVLFGNFFYQEYSVRGASKTPKAAKTA